jgi:poly(beta-D-mannuronate) lyase
MNKSLFIISLFLLLISCNKNTTHTILVSNSSELNDAIKNGKPGDDIVLKNGVWKDVAIQFRGKGTKENPITIAAETAGKVSVEGKSYLKFGGEYLVVKDLLFQNGYSPSNAVVDFRIDKKEIANNCKLTNCVILDFNKPKRDNADLWVQFWGRNNELSNSYLAGKTNKGPTVRVSIEGIESINNYHQIINNHFGPRPVKGGPSGETIQLGNSYTSMSPSYTTVANNLFEKCNGEVEIISSKTNFNTFKNNVFYMSEGSVVTRHGNYATIDGNYFIGDGVNENIGGIRIINTGHWVVNNYFYNLIGKNFRSPLAVMNGIPKSPLNRYNQVTDVVVAYNTYVNCESPWQFGVGQNLAQKEVLPKSEIRSARPIRTTVANNIIYNKKGYKDIVVEHDKADGVTFASNVVDNKGVSFNDFDNGLKAVSLNLKKISDHIQLPTETPNAVKAYKGFDFNTIEKDLFGNSRKNNTSIGATVSTEIQNPNILDKTKYGASWFSNEVEPREPVTHTVTTAEDIQAKIDTAENGDIINLNFNNSQIDKSIIINKTITITGNGKATLKYNGKKETPLFSLQPKGKLTIEKVILKGNHTNYLFASLQKNMSHHFGLSVSKCEISDFNYVLKVYKESFAERITFKNTSISNCENGLELSEETNDKGDYNTEYLTIDNCTFNTIQKNVIDYYRGGYDESTIGGNLSITNSTFTNSGSKEKNTILLNHRGIINVNLSNNTFKNNKVKLVSLLWGAKNNKASNNTIINSGKIKTEQNLKLTLMY